MNTLANNTFNSYYDSTSYLNKHSKQQDLAARKIQLFFRKILAAKAYKHMFDNGEYFKQYEEIIPKQKKLKDYLHIAQILSTKAINEIKASLGEINDQEKLLLKKIIENPNFKLKHQSSYYLDKLGANNKNTLTIYSHNKLGNHNLVSHTFNKDIKNISNNDFIFFSMDFSNSDLSIKPKSIFDNDNTYYGYRAYLSNLPKNKFGYLTLTDHFYNTIAISYQRESFLAKFPKLGKYIFAGYNGSLGKTDIPIFTEKDMLKGLAYHAISLIRKAESPELNQFIYQDSGLTAINDFLSIVFTPEFHIPRIFSTTNFSLHLLRKPEIEEVYKISTFYKETNSIAEYCFDQQQTTNAETSKKYIPNHSSSYNLQKFIDLAIHNSNPKILVTLINWRKQLIDIGWLKDTFYSNVETTTFIQKICLGVLQYESRKVIASINKSKANGLSEDLANYLCNILLKSAEFREEIVFLLDNFLPIEHPQSHVNKLKKIDLYVLSKKITDISSQLISTITHEEIITHLINNRIFSEKHEDFKLDYAGLISKALTTNNYNIDVFSDRLHLYVWRYINKEAPEIRETTFLALLKKLEDCPQVQNTLQQAFIASEMLKPSKNISSLPEQRLQEYATIFYGIQLAIV